MIDYAFSVFVFVENVIKDISDFLFQNNNSLSCYKSISNFVESKIDLTVK